MNNAMIPVFSPVRELTADDIHRVTEVRDNLWDPRPGDRGAHRRFTSRSIEPSPQTWLNEHLPLAVAVMFGVATTTALAARFVSARR